MMTIAEAIRYSGVKGMQAATIASKRFANNKSNHEQTQGLNIDELAAIHLYTQGCGMYRILNRALISRDRTEIKPLLPYLRLLMQGLQKLPRLKNISVYRGVRKDLGEKFKKGDQVIWWPVSSTSRSLGVMQQEQFCGTRGSRTMFHIHCQHAVDISTFSAYPQEDEILLFPGTQLLVNGIVSMSDGLVMIQLEETDLPLTLLEFEGPDEPENFPWWHLTRNRKEVIFLFIVFGSIIGVVIWKYFLSSL
jgi:hypothetical protein